MFKTKINNVSKYEDINKIKEVLANSLNFINRPLEQHKRYLVKPNLLKPSLAESAITTHPAIIRAVIELIKDAGASAIIGDSPGIGSAERVLKKLQLIDFLRKTDTKIADFSKNRLVKNEKNLIYKEIRLPEIIFEVDEIINIPKLKTHQMMVLTLAVKNLYGFIYGIEKIKYHFLADKDYSKFAELLLDIYRNINPQINILDGISGMEGNGPSNGRIRNFNILALSNNPLSLDFSISKIFNLDVTKIPLFEVALKENFLEIKEQFMDISTEIPFSSQRILLPKAHRLNFSLPPVVTKVIKEFLIPYPSIDKRHCINCKICQKTCPVSAISEKKFLVIDKKKCIRCYCCQELCEKGAIKVKRGVVSVWKQ